MTWKACLEVKSCMISNPPKPIFFSNISKNFAVECEKASICHNGYLQKSRSESLPFLCYCLSSCARLGSVWRAKRRLRVDPLCAADKQLHGHSKTTVRPIDTVWIQYTNCPARVLGRVSTTSSHCSCGIQCMAARLRTRRLRCSRGGRLRTPPRKWRRTRLAPAHFNETCFWFKACA